MELQFFPLGQFETFILSASRVIALLGAITVFSGRQVPPQVRIILALAFALLMFPTLEQYIPIRQYHPLEFFRIIIYETLLGAIIGMIPRIMFGAIQFAGILISRQMGFMAANVFDPQSQQQIPLLGQFYNILAILLFINLDIHHVFIRAIVSSYQILPFGSFNFTGGAAQYLIELTSWLFVFGIKLAAPLIAILLINKLMLGLMGRMFSQLNVLMLSFPLNISTALILMAIILQLTIKMIANEFGKTGEQLHTLLLLL